MENPLNKTEMEALRLLGKSKSVPSDRLEANVIAALRKQKLFGHQGPLKRWGWRIAASFVLLYSLGFVTHILLQKSSDVTEYSYMLVLHEDDQFQTDASPQQMFSEYAQWMKKVNDSGINIEGQELALPSSLLQSERNGMKVNQSISSRVTGYFLMDTDSYEKAIQIASQSPHLKYGGKIEVKEIVKH